MNLNEVMKKIRNKNELSSKEVLRKELEKLEQKRNERKKSLSKIEKKYNLNIENK